MPTKSTGKKSVKKPTARKPTVKQREAEERARKQMWAVVLFAVGLLLGFLAFVPGSSYWATLHTGLFGLFGFGAYLLGPLLIYVAVSASLDKPAGPVSHKLWQGGTLLLLLCALLQILGMGLPKSIGFAYSVTELFQAGIDLRGGGLMGTVIGLPLLYLFERTGALITVSLLIFLFLMLVTGSTLMELFSSAAKPVKKLEQVYNEKVEERRSNPPEERRRRFNIDIPVDDPPAKEELTPLPDPLPVAVVTPPVEPAPTPDPVVLPEPEPETEEPPNAYLDEIIRRAAQSSRKARTPAQPLSDAAPLPDQLAFEEPPSPEEEDSPADSSFEENTGENDALENDTLEDNPSPDDDPFPLDEAQAQERLPVPVPEKVYVYPSITLLKEPVPDLEEENTPEELRANAQRLVDTLLSFGVQTRIIDICRGPAVTRYELQPSAGVKISKITGLADDIALNLAASGVRIEAPIPNKAAVGIEIPNRTVSAVTLREILDSTEFVSAKSKLSVAMGRDIAGNVMIADIAKMPHVLIAGATGSGKSVCINSIIMSLLYKASDQEVKFLMIDPKVVELGIYNGIPHLLVPVVTDPKKAAGALNWAVAEMLKRYQIFAENSVRDLSAYNELARSSDTLPPLPQIVIIIDELSDLMMATPGDVEDAICRLAQMARAAGMHLVIATQRPSVDVITGVIKANIPSRVAFAVSSQVDSRTILDGSGAEKLLGRGDMLFAPVGVPKPIRVQGCFVTDKEVERVVEFIKEGEKHQYDSEIMEEIERQVPREKGQHSSSDDGGGFEESDDMLPAAIEAVIETGQASTSFLQRRLKIGYARAGRLIDEMDQMGIVGPFEGSKPRQVLISKDRWYEMKLTSQETIE